MRFRIVYSNQDWHGWGYKYLVQEAESFEDCEHIFNEAVANTMQFKHAKLIRIERIQED